MLFELMADMYARFTCKLLNIVSLLCDMLQRWQTHVDLALHAWAVFGNAMLKSTVFPIPICCNMLVILVL